MVDSLRKKIMLEVPSSNPSLWILKTKTSPYCSLWNFIISVFKQLFLNVILFFSIFPYSINEVDIFSEAISRAIRHQRRAVFRQHHWWFAKFRNI